MNKDQIQNIIIILGTMYPNAKPALIFKNNYELLISVILSAQCTDERVNRVTKVLFSKYSNPYDISTMEREELERIIFPCGLYHEKAKNIISASNDIINIFDGQIPDNMNDLMKLRGVGRKTANVVLAVGFNKDAFAVDTHVFRVAKRIGIAKGKNPLEVEKSLMKNIDQKLWSKAHHYIIYHGRQVCSARNPKCYMCKLNDLCEYNKKEIKKG